jgi:ribosomal protein S25
VPDFLTEKRKEITARMDSLAPAVAEYERLKQAATALDSVAAASSNGAPPVSPSVRRRRRPGRPPGAKTASRRASKAARAASASTTKPTAKRRAGRRKGTGKRAGEALAAIQNQPGISIPDLADRMGIKQNYLYRILPQLEAEGKIKKEGRAWQPVAA